VALSNPTAPLLDQLQRHSASSGSGFGRRFMACVTLNNTQVNVYYMAISIGGNRYIGFDGASHARAGASD
jgi:hypothetical protein